MIFLYTPRSVPIKTASVRLANPSSWRRMHLTCSGAALHNIQDCSRYRRNALNARALFGSPSPHGPIA